MRSYRSPGSYLWVEAELNLSTDRGNNIIGAIRKLSIGADADLDSRPGPSFDGSSSEGDKKQKECLKNTLLRSRC